MTGFHASTVDVLVEGAGRVTELLVVALWFGVAMAYAIARARRSGAPLESLRAWRRFLQVCSPVAPALGLLGTAAGIVAALPVLTHDRALGLTSIGAAASSTVLGIVVTIAYRVLCRWVPLEDAAPPETG